MVAAADRLMESMARPFTPPAAKQLLRLAQRLEAERAAGAGQLVYSGVKLLDYSTILLYYATTLLR